MNEQTWRNYVEKYQGAFVVWVDQSTDTLLNVNNSGGVCFAMALDFVTAYQAGQPGPFDFVNGIRDTAIVPPNTNRVPQKYLDMQASLQAMLDEFRLNLELLQMEYEVSFENQKPEVLKNIKQFMDDRIKQRYGPGMATYEKFKESSLFAAVDLFNKMKATVTQNGNSYFLVEMRVEKGSGGHAIGFGFRPDLSGSDKFPALYEFFDANLGLFVFPSVDKLLNFFTDKVWLEVYSKKNYTNFAIASYTAKTGKR